MACEQQEKCGGASNAAAITVTTDIAIATVTYHINNIQIQEQVKALTGMLWYSRRNFGRQTLLHRDDFTRMGAERQMERGHVHSD